MFKMVGMCLILLTTTFAGSALSADLKRRIRDLRLCADLIAKIGREISYSRCPITEVLGRCAQEKKYAPLRFLQLSKPFDSERFRLHYEKNRDSLCLKNEDHDLILEFFADFGKSDAVGELARCGKYEAELARRVEELEPAIEKQAKLYRSLGVLSGVFLSILMV
ncbi:stage III sporulation protein AB [Feifania hominis]|uniref:Stage III sporulation protein AB n=1 Tax=Feifania hominis TaxID=2763660 RepID=A0A926HUG7_9FIRM|nr:stage III sporulation protein AB [Feifania hominis]MBC8535536.1 stage III sporulation protein AB [Feifania hominis]